MADGVTLVGYGEGGYIFKSVLFIYEVVSAQDCSRTHKCKVSTQEQFLKVAV